MTRPRRGSWLVDPMKILILKPSSLGDVIQALPVLRLLKRQLPRSQIHWWLSTSLQGLLEEDPDLAGIYGFQRRGWWKSMPRVVRAIRQQRFDLVLDLQSLARSGLVAWLARAQRVVGLADPREGAAMFHDVSLSRPSPEAHAVDWYLEAVRWLGLEVDWNFEWLPLRKPILAKITAKWPLAERRWILLQPGARWLNKRWPLESFARLVSQLSDADPTLGFAVLGATNEHELGQRIAQSLPGRVLDLTGELSLPEMIEWVRAASVLVTNDTGPMHAAAAVGTPVAALFGPTSPLRTGPYGQMTSVLRLTLPCIPCLKSECEAPIWRQCLEDMPVDRVAAEVRKRLINPGKRPMWAPEDRGL